MLVKLPIYINTFKYHVSPITGTKIRKGNGNTNALLFSLKILEIVHQERRGQVKTILMEHFDGILFDKSGPANKQYTNGYFVVNATFSTGLEGC
jgi:hypothetical protein